MNEVEFLTYFESVIKRTDELKGHLIRPISQHHRLVDDLGFDSVALMIILYELQEKKPDLKVAELKNWKTVHDIYRSMGFE